MDKPNNEILMNLLKIRGLEKKDDIEEFLSENPRLTYDPFLMKDLDKAVNCIVDSIQKNDTICIYGDYDADGVTSVTLMFQFLSDLTNKLFYYIPSRFDEGYGLNNEAIKEISTNGANLIITVDCGSVSYNEVEYAKKLGMKVVITDHHTVSENKADCILVNPKRNDCNYPFKDLAGVGVAFKVIQGIQKKLNLSKQKLAEVLDLVAIGTVGDVMSLTDENRTLVKYGIKQMKKGNRKSLQMLMEKIKIANEDITSQDIAYKIVPHINASGRMSDAKIGVELLLEQNHEEIEYIVDEIVENNLMRKAIQKENYEMCKNIVQEKYLQDDFLMIEFKNAHEGIAGIVAGKIKDEYKKPTVILTETEDGNLKGTGRSTDNIDLFKILNTQQSLFEKFGGHKAACGFLITKDNFKILKKEINYLMCNDLQKFIIDRKIVNQYEVSIKNINNELYNTFNLLEPCGKDNEIPKLIVRGVNVKNIASLGSMGIHAKFVAYDDENEFEVLAFNNGYEIIKKIKFFNYSNIKLIGHINKSLWNGKEKVQLILSDILES